MAERVLLGTDDCYIVALISTELKANNYEVIVAYDIFETLSKAYIDSPKLIILDIKMPVNISLWCLNKLKMSRKTAKIPIIFVSPYNNEDMRQKSLELGVSDFIVKPFNVNGLLVKVKKILRKNNERKES